MSKRVKLAPCRFCHSAKNVSRFEYEYREYRHWVCGVICHACNARVQGTALFTEELSHTIGACVRKWNRGAVT